MASIKTGSTVGGVAILTSLGIPNISDTGNVGDYLGTGRTAVRAWLPPVHSSGGFGYLEGFYAGGQTPPVPTGDTSEVLSFPFSAPFTLGTSIGNLTQTRKQLGGNSSPTTGYGAGGIKNPSPSGITYYDRVDSFPFTATPFSSTDEGNLSQVRGYVANEGAQDDTNAFTLGGGYPPSSTYLDTVDRYPFSGPWATATDLGNLSVGRNQASGMSSNTEAWCGGGQKAPPLPTSRVNTVDKFPFAASPGFTATDEGDLSQSRNGAAAHSSSTEGWVSGGVIASDRVDKFPFAASPGFTATDEGNLTVANGPKSGHGSATDGWTSGTPQVIEKFPFSAPFTTATDMGDMSPNARYGHAGLWY